MLIHRWRFHLSWNVALYWWRSFHFLSLQHMPVASPHSWCLPSCPFLPVFSMPFPFSSSFPPFLSHHFPSLLFLPSPHLRSTPPSLLRLWVLGSAEAPPVGQTVFGELQAKIAPVVAMVLRRFTSTWSIAKNVIRYLGRQSQHAIYCAMGPKSFSAG